MLFIPSPAGSLLIILALCHGSSQNFLPTSGRTALQTNGTYTVTAPIFLTGMPLVHKTREQFFTPEVNQFGMDIAGQQQHVKPHEWTTGPAGGHLMESGSEN